jgi:hypothetical protein
VWFRRCDAGLWLPLSRRSHDRWISGLVALHWAWFAGASHVVFFTRMLSLLCTAWP